MRKLHARILRLVDELHTEGKNLQAESQALDSAGKNGVTELLCADILKSAADELAHVVSPQEAIPPRPAKLAQSDKPADWVAPSYEEKRAAIKERRRRG